MGVGTSQRNYWIERANKSREKKKRVSRKDAKAIGNVSHGAREVSMTDMRLLEQPDLFLVFR